MALGAAFFDILGTVVKGANALGKAEDSFGALFSSGASSSSKSATTSGVDSAQKATTLPKKEQPKAEPMQDVQNLQLMTTAMLDAGQQITDQKLTEAIKAPNIDITANIMETQQLADVLDQIKAQTDNNPQAAEKFATTLAQLNVQE